MISAPANTDWNLPEIAASAGATEFYYLEGELYANCSQDALNTAIAEYDPIARANDAKVKLFTDAVQAHMNAEAQKRGYDDIFTAISYTTSTNVTFNAEAIAYRDWRDDVWTICHALLADWQAGGTEPTIEEVLTSLPAPTLP